MSEMFIPARQFLLLRALGAPAYVVSLALQGIFRGFKDTKTPVYCLGQHSLNLEYLSSSRFPLVHSSSYLRNAGIGNFLAVFLFPLFIYQFKMGVAGAAISSVISQYVSKAFSASPAFLLLSTLQDGFSLILRYTVAILMLMLLNKRVILLPPKLGSLKFGDYLKSGTLFL